MQPIDGGHDADQEILELLYERRLPVLRRRVTQMLAGWVDARSVVLLERQGGRWCVTGQWGESPLPTADAFLGGRRPVEPAAHAEAAQTPVTVVREDVMVRLDHPQAPPRILYALRRSGASALERSVIAELARIAPFCAVALATARADAETGQVDPSRAEQWQMREQELRDRAYRLSSAVNRELRTPLTAVLGFAERLADGDHPAGETAEIVLRNSRRLAALLDDAAELARLEARRYTLVRRPVYPREILDQVRMKTAHVFRARQLSLELDAGTALPKRVDTDGDRLLRVLLAVCRAGARSAASSVLTINVEWRPSEQILHFSLSGLRGSEDLRRLAEPPAFPPGGLEVAMARQTARALGGALTAGTTADGGETLELVIPAVEGGATEHAHSERPPTAATTEGTTPVVPASGLAGHVLLAESEPDNRRLLRGLIEKAGPEVSAVDGGPDAVETALAWDFDLVIVNTGLAEVDGLQVARLLRESGFSRPMVALTGETDPAHLDDCMNAGFSAVLVMPVERRDLNQRLGQYLPSADRAASSLEVDTRELTREFVAALNDYLDPLKRGIEGEDWPSVLAEAHKLKGTAGNFGFPRISRCAADLERRVKVGDTSEPSLGEALGRLLEACEEAQRDYRE